MENVGLSGRLLFPVQDTGCNDCIKLFFYHLNKLMLKDYEKTQVKNHRRRGTVRTLCTLRSSVMDQILSSDRYYRSYYLTLSIDSKIKVKSWLKTFLIQSRPTNRGVRQLTLLTM